MRQIHPPQRRELGQSVFSLINTALGREKADIVIKHACLVSVNSGEMVEDTDVAIKMDRIALVGKADHTIGNDTIVVDAVGGYLVPGFLDGHVHIESSMVTLTQYAKTVLLHGTTGVFIDPHEIANVLGLSGVKLMLNEAKKLPLKVFITIPSCVPSAPDFETSGARIQVTDVEKALKWKNVIGLGEVMDYQGVLDCKNEVLAKIQATLKAKKTVEGHAVGLLKEKLAAYASAGISSCHESTTIVDAVQRLRLGLYTMIREGSASRNLSEVIKCITEMGLDPRHVILVTDDRDPETLVKLGHMDHTAKRAIEEGIDPVVAIQMVTINTAEHFGLSDHLGSIAPSKIADMLILNDIKKMKIRTTIVDGQIVAHNNEMLVDFVAPAYSLHARNSIRLKRRMEEKDFEISAKEHLEKIRVNVIGIQENTIITKHLQATVDIEEGRVKTDPRRNIAKIAIVERHMNTGNISLGFVHGFGIERGAIASSVAHDSHNIIVVGIDDHDMKTAVNKLAETGGGFVTVDSKRVTCMLQLPIAGLMSDKSIEIVCRQMKQLRKAASDLGCKKASLLMNMTFLALPVIPEIRITDLGLVDTCHFRFLALEASIQSNKKNNNE